MRKRWIAGGSAVVATAGATIWAMPMAEAPDAPKDCSGDPADLAGLATPGNATMLPAPGWAQDGGSINDESCLDRTAIRGVTAPHNENELRNALLWAAANNQQVTAAGMRHSMGGQAFSHQGVVIDMRRMNAIHLDAEARTITVGAGARWHDIQNAIHPHFAVKAMQSTDVFTVGGSIAVNAHGMDHRAGALMRSIRSLKVMQADGSIVTASPSENTDLFRHVVGGYGLFGIVTEAVLDVVPNDVYQSSRQTIASADFPTTFAALEADPAVGLTYTHLSTSPGSLFDEALVYSYRRNPEDQALTRPPLGDVSAVTLRRLLINMSKRADWLKSVKWWSEKHIEHRLESCTITRQQAMQDGEACLVSRNEPMHDSVPYLYNNLKGETDILHEYFVPRENITPFINAVRADLQAHHANLVNASIRAVDVESNALSYAPKPAFSLVLYITQPTTPQGNRDMAALTSALIDTTQRFGGRFFLPYQLHYTPQQLEAAYPEIRDFFAAKRRYDPQLRFRNRWWDRYAPAFPAGGETASG